MVSATLLLPGGLATLVVATTTAVGGHHRGVKGEVLTQQLQLVSDAPLPVKVHPAVHPAIGLGCGADGVVHSKTKLAGFGVGILQHNNAHVYVIACVTRWKLHWVDQSAVDCCSSYTLSSEVFCSIAEATGLVHNCCC